MSLPAFDPDFTQYDRITSDQIGSGLQHSYNRYLEGVKTIVASLDVPVGLTPKEVVWQLNKAKLFRYKPRRHPSERYPVPLILVIQPPL